LSAKQSRRMSLVEAFANVAVGFAVALLTQIIVFPLFDLEVTLGENLAIGGLFTLLCGAPHNSVYAESMIMRSPRRQSGGRRGVGARITPHNSSISRHLAWSGACRVLRSDRAVASVWPFNGTAASTGRTVNYAERDVRLCQPNHLLNIKIFRSLGADSA
jgi:hypothetical protein